MPEKSKTKLKFYSAETVKVLPYRRSSKGQKYAITSHGRVIRFFKNLEDGEFAKSCLKSHDYPSVFIMANGKRTNAMIHRLVAMMFLPKPKSDQVFVIHKDRNNQNNHFSNLKWANRKEHVKHMMGGERWKAQAGRLTNTKLGEDQVRTLKKKMKAGKTSIPILAKKLGISNMQLYRIRSGENWGWVK